MKFVFKIGDRAEAAHQRRRALLFGKFHQQARKQFYAHRTTEPTVDENLLVPVERPGPWTVSRVYEAFPRLAERRANKGAQLSGGEQEMLSIARALLLNPKLLMLDEPSQGLAPLIVEDVFRIVVAARREGVSVLLVEQNVRAAVEIADRAYVLDDGRIVYEGDARAFGADEQRVRELAGASAEKWDIDG